MVTSVTTDTGTPFKPAVDCVPPVGLPSVIAFQAVALRVSLGVTLSKHGFERIGSACTSFLCKLVQDAPIFPALRFIALVRFLARAIAALRPELATLEPFLKRAKIAGLDCRASHARND